MTFWEPLCHAGQGAGNCLTALPTLVPQESLHPPLPGNAPPKSLSGCVTWIVTDPLWALGFSLKKKKKRWGEGSGGGGGGGERTKEDKNGSPRVWTPVGS